jgi:ribosomal protein S18 acetylase RimI-like enzyme
VETAIIEVPTISSGDLATLDNSQNIPDFWDIVKTESETWLGYKFPSEFEILPSKAEHAGQVAMLHIEGIKTGFISSLGLDFVTALYEAIAESEHAFGFVCTSPDKPDKILGFVAFSSHLGSLYKSVLKKKGLRFTLILAKKMSSFGRIKRVCETLLYPNKTDKMELPEPELLSIVIAPEARRMGIGSMLIDKGLEHCLSLGIEKVKVLVAGTNEPANCLYQKCGFEFVQQIDSHGVLSNLYVCDTATTTKPVPKVMLDRAATMSTETEKFQPILAA